MLLTVLSVKAQESVETRIFPTNQIIAPHLIEVTFSKTVHILFPSEVKYVDLGSYDIIADKATGAENVVRIKSAVKGFEGETNFSVITADGCFYSFNVVYKNEPAQLSIEMEDWLRKNPMGGAADDRMFVKLKELGGETPLVVNRIMYTLYKKNKRDIRHIGCKKYGIQTLLKGMEPLAQQFPGVKFGVPEVKWIIDDRPAAWAFVPDGLLDGQQRETLGKALLAL